MAYYTFISAFAIIVSYHTFISYLSKLCTDAWNEWSVPLLIERRL